MARPGLLLPIRPTISWPKATRGPTGQPLDFSTRLEVRRLLAVPHRQTRGVGPSFTPSAAADPQGDRNRRGLVRTERRCGLRPALRGLRPLRLTDEPGGGLPIGLATAAEHLRQLRQSLFGRQRADGSESSPAP